ncbi:MAG: membrane or secreted protein [Flammeovirgaceae bacterium]|nr:membrane or secreted protein [Flammeovirgaceae bacterium]
MIMHNILLFFISIFFNFSNEIENTSWIHSDNGIYELRIYSDKYFSSTKYNLESKEFISTMGGLYSLEDVYYEVLEFNSKDSSKVGDTIFYSNIKIKMKNDSGSMKIDGKEFSKNTDENNLSGSWLMSGIERRGEMRMRDVNRPRKTMKILAGNRFQWIAYDISKKGFYGTGGGTYTAVDGKYVENIDFFSRDSNTVGKSLEFDFEIKDGDWHHKGFSSKGDPKYEIWTQRKQ